MICFVAPKLLLSAPPIVFHANPTVVLQATIDAAPDGSEIRLAPGTYSDVALRIDKDLTLVGAGDSTLLTSHSNEPIIAWSGTAKRLEIRDLAITYLGGFRDAEQNDGIRGGSINGQLIAKNLTVTDLASAIYLTSEVAELFVSGCTFRYTYGRAGVSIRKPFDHPVVAILGAATRTEIRDCTFNGLLDDTFTNVSGEPPLALQTPADGLFKSGGSNPSTQIIEGNTIVNHGIEGILVEREDGSGKYRTRVSRNTVTGPAMKRSDFYGGYTPGIVVINSRGAIISDNFVANEQIGIDVSFHTFNLQNSIFVMRNTIISCVIGVSAAGNSIESSFEENFVHLSSEPVKSSIGQQAFPGELRGFSINAGTVTDNEIVSSGPEWDFETTLISRNGDALTLSDTSDLTPNSGTLLAFTPNGISYFPVREISGNTVTTDSDWSRAQPTAPGSSLHYLRTTANFDKIAAICMIGASSEDRVFAHRNLIIGTLQDVVTNGVGKLTTDSAGRVNVLFQQNATSSIIRNAEQQRKPNQSFPAKSSRTKTKF